MIKPKLVSCILAILVIVIGVVIVVKLISLCRRLFPDTPPEQVDPTNVVQTAWIMASGGNATAKDAFMDPQGESCFFSFDLFLGADGLCLTNCFIPGLVAGDVLRTELASVGLDSTRTSYGANTDPAEIYYAQGTVRVGEGVTAVIEQSIGGADWLPVLTNGFSAGQTLRLTVPVPCGSNAFFRAVLQ